MQTEQLNLRVPSALADRLRSDAFDRKILPRDVVVELLETKYGPQAPEPIDGQLTVDEAQAENGEPASRRPRAARKAERSIDSPPPEPTGSSSSTAPDGEEAAGCPECAGSVEQGQCVECGWINVT